MGQTASEKRLFKEVEELKRQMGIQHNRVSGIEGALNTRIFRLELARMGQGELYDAEGTDDLKTYKKIVLMQEQQVQALTSDLKNLRLAMQHMVPQDTYESLLRIHADLKAREAVLEGMLRSEEKRVLRMRSLLGQALDMRHFDLWCRAPYELYPRIEQELVRP